MMKVDVEVTMPIESLSSSMELGLAAQAGGGPVSPLPDEARFRQLLASSQGGAVEQEDAREAAEQLVSTALIMPLLKEMRDQPLDSDLFGDSMAEDAFRQRLDQQFADRMVRGTNFPLVDHIYQAVSRSASQRGTEVNAVG